jgi:hypothetical protein
LRHEGVLSVSRPRSSDQQCRKLNRAKRKKWNGEEIDHFTGKVLFLTDHCQYLCGALRALPLSGIAGL